MKILSLLATCLVSVLSGCNPSSNVLNNAQIKERLPHKASVVWNPVVLFSNRESNDTELFDKFIYDYPAPNVQYYMFYAKTYDYTRIKDYEVGVDSLTRNYYRLAYSTNLSDLNIDYNAKYFLEHTDLSGVDYIQFILCSMMITVSGNNYVLSSGMTIYSCFNTDTCGGYYFSSDRYLQDYQVHGFENFGSGTYYRYTAYYTLDDSYYYSGKDYFPNGYWFIPYQFINYTNGQVFDVSLYQYCPVSAHFIHMEKSFTASGDYKNAIYGSLGVQGLLTLVDNSNNANADDLNGAYNNGYDNGLSAGYDDGYQTGHDVGYQEGLNVNNPYTFGALFGAIADTPVLIFRQMFNFDLFGINALVVIMSLFTALLLIFIFKKLIK